MSLELLPYLSFSRKPGYNHAMSKKNLYRTLFILWVVVMWIAVLAPGVDAARVSPESAETVVTSWWCDPYGTPPKESAGTGGGQLEVPIPTCLPDDEPTATPTLNPYPAPPGKLTPTPQPYP